MSREIYAAPWAEPLVRPTAVELVEYGPTTSTQARQYAAYRDWAWRPHSRRARADGLDMLAAWMRAGGTTVRAELPDRELEVFTAVVEQGHSTRWVARAFGIQRSSVQTYLRRLRARAARWFEGDREAALDEAA